MRNLSYLIRTGEPADMVRKNYVVEVSERDSPQEGYSWVSHTKPDSDIWVSVRRSPSAREGSTWRWTFCSTVTMVQNLGVSSSVPSTTVHSTPARSQSSL